MFIVPRETRRDTFQFRAFNKNFFLIGRWMTFSALGFFVGSTIIVWFFGKSNYNQTSIRNFFNEKLLKYIPMEYGGNFFFPFSAITAQHNISYPKTQWSSFDKKSFFPHTDKFKMKVAIAHEDIFMLKTLLDRDFNVNSIIDNEKNYTPIALASILGKHDLIDYLFSRGANLESIDDEGNTPLMLAVIYDHPKAVSNLIKLGADLQKKDVYGFSAIEKAEKRGNSQMVQYLSEVKQQVCVPNVKPFTYNLESYDFMQVNRAKELVDKYDIGRYFKPQIYPYFQSTKGFLLYMFPAIDAEDIEIHISPSVFYNHKDDKITSDQDLFTFGEIIKSRMDSLK